MSLARAVGELYGELTRRYDSDTANALIDYVLEEHARDLAEKQRAALARDPGISEENLIRVIDPEVE